MMKSYAGPADHHSKHSPWKGDAERRALAELRHETQPVHVLLAEDDSDMRNLVASNLRRAGVVVIEARTGAELLRLVSSHLLRRTDEFTVDMIISDVRMPGKSGLEILAELRAAGCWTPVILITAFGDEALHAEAYRLGAVAVFNKPFDVKALSALVRAIAAE
jgi:DNA-binding response OmpR family regulator